MPKDQLGQHLLASVRWHRAPKWLWERICTAHTAGESSGARQRPRFPGPVQGPLTSCQARAWGWRGILTAQHTELVSELQLVPGYMLIPPKGSLRNAARGLGLRGPVLRAPAGHVPQSTLPQPGVEVAVSATDGSRVQGTRSKQWEKEGPEHSRVGSVPNLSPLPLSTGLLTPS